MNLFTDVELIIMASILGFLLLIVIILSISEIISKRKEKNIILEESLENDGLDTLSDNVVLKMENKESNSTEDDNLYNTLMNLNKIEDKPINVEGITKFEEVNPVNKEILEIEVQSDLKVQENNSVETDEIFFEEITEIEPVVNVVKVESEELLELNSRERAQIELLKIEEQLEHESSLEDTITNLEAIEEENAIISYQELLNTKELNVVNCDDGDEPITINEVFKLFNENKEEDLKIMEIVDAIPLSEAYHGDFTSTPYLSPINGLETESLSEIQLENTANLEKLEKEIRKTNEFLNILNELKKNLE